MVDFKVVMNDPKTGRSFSKEVKDEKASPFLNLNIGDKVKGDLFDMAGYEFEITGGSDNCGFPMRKDVGTDRKKILAVEGIGLKKKNDGIRQRKTVCGRKINANIVQINLKVIKYGKAKLGEEAQSEASEDKGKKEVEAKEVKKEMPPAEKASSEEQDKNPVEGQKEGQEQVSEDEKKAVESEDEKRDLKEEK